MLLEASAKSPTKRKTQRGLDVAESVPNSSCWYRCAALAEPEVSVTLKCCTSCAEAASDARERSKAPCRLALCTLALLQQLDWAARLPRLLEPAIDMYTSRTAPPWMAALEAG